MQKPIKLTLESEAFNAFKQDFHMLLNSTLATMQQKEVEDASISVKFDISLQTLANPNVDAPDSSTEREVVVPMFKHKVTAAMKIKSEKSGFVGGPDYELVWDKQNQAWTMKPIKDTQTSLFDSDYDYGAGEDEEDE